MTTALAFDQATTTGYTFGGTKIDLPQWQSGHFQALKRPLPEERLVLIEDTAGKLMDQFKPDIVIFEQPFNPTFSDSKKGVQRIQFDQKVMEFLSGVMWAVRMAAARRAIPTEGYAPRTWRSALDLPSKPRLTMDDIAERAKAGIEDKVARFKGDEIKKLTREAVRRLGAHVETLDEADSWGLCYYALCGKAGARRAQEDLLDRIVDTV